MNKGYVNYLIGDKKSENTIKSYTKYIEEALDVIGKEDTEITKADIINWKASISNFAPSTVSLKMSALASYFEYLEEIGEIEKSPMDKMKRPKIKHKSKHYMDAQMLRNMVKATTNSRDKAIVLMLGNTGLRVSELLGITLEEYEDARETREICITGKGDKERLIFLNDELVEAIDEYVAERKCKDACPYLFTSTWGGQIHRNNLSGTLKVIAKKAGVPFWEDICNHALRSACITINLEAGTPINIVRDMVGHSSIATTNIYAKGSVDSVKRAMMASAF